MRVLYLILSVCLAACAPSGKAVSVSGVTNATVLADVYARDAQATEYARSWDAEIARRTLVAADAQATSTAAAQATGTAAMMVSESATAVAVVQATGTAAVVMATETQVAFTVNATKTQIALDTLNAERDAMAARARFWQVMLWGCGILFLVFFAGLGCVGWKWIDRKAVIQTARQDLPDGQSVFVFPVRGGMQIVKPSLLLQAGGTVCNNDILPIENAETALAMATIETQARVLLGAVGQAAGDVVAEKIGTIATQIPLPGSGQAGRDGLPGHPGRDGRGKDDIFALNAVGQGQRFDFLGECGLERSDLQEFCTVAWEQKLARSFWLEYQFESGKKLTRGSYEILMSLCKRIGVTEQNAKTNAWQFVAGLDARKVRNKILSA